MLSETDNVLCPECWKNQPQKKKFSINIRETLETQVTVEAENKEDALREAEKRWKNGEYILDADNFQVRRTAASMAGWPTATSQGKKYE